MNLLLLHHPHELVLNLGLGKEIHKCKGWETLLQPSFSRSDNSAKELVCLRGWQQNGEED